MKKKETKLEEYRKIYGFNPGKEEWVPKGGDMINYIGQEVLYIKYTKDEKAKGGWSTEMKAAKIISMGNMEDKLLSYETEIELISEKKTINSRISPEGFSTDLLTGKSQTSFIRLMPFSLHYKCMETEAIYKRLADLWEERDTISLNDLISISKESDQNTLLNFTKNIQFIIKTVASDTEDEVVLSDEVLAFRVSQLKMKKIGGNWKLTVKDQNNQSITVDVDEGYNYYEIPGVGDAKIIDSCSLDVLQDTDGKPAMKLDF